MNLGTRVETKREQALKQDALVKAMGLPREYFRSMTVGPPPRFGMAKQTLRVEEVLATGRSGMLDRRMDYSGGIGSYTATARNSLGGGSP